MADIRPECQELFNRIEHIDADNLYEAVSEIKYCLQNIVLLLDKALPMYVPYD